MSDDAAHPTDSTPADSISADPTPADAWLSHLIAQLPRSPRVAFAQAARRDWQDDLRPSELAWVRDAHPERRASFAAGRHLARRALASLGAPDTDLGRVPGTDANASRAPDWPNGCVGSISHAAMHAVAVAAKRADVEAIGIDLEVASRVHPELLARICTGAELDRLRAAGDDPHQGALHFVAKEAFYKLWHPATGQSPGFRDVEISLLGEDRFRLDRVGGLSRPLHGESKAEPHALAQQVSFEGTWGVFEGLLTAVIVAPAQT